MILFCGFPKVGNTWIKFIVFNYFNILNNNANRTLTFSELRRLELKSISFHFSHLPYSGRLVIGYDDNAKDYHKKFKRMIYIYRNPFDTLISFYHYIMNRVEGSFNEPHKTLYKKLKRFQDFIAFFLPQYIDHVKSTKHRADLVLNYDILRKDTRDFRKLIELICKETKNIFDVKIYRKALKFSSFDNIKKMGIKYKEEGGLASGYLGHFCRNGKSGQYKRIMNKEMIGYIKQKCKESGINI